MKREILASSPSSSPTKPFMVGFNFPDFQNTSNVVGGAAQLKLVRFYLEAPLTINFIDIQVTLLSAGSFISVGIYSNDGTKLLVNSGLMSGAAVGVVTSAIVPSVTLPSGPYWYAYAASDAIVQALEYAAFLNLPLFGISGTSRVPQYGVIAAVAVGGQIPPTFSIAAVGLSNIAPLASVFRA